MNQERMGELTDFLVQLYRSGFSVRDGCLYYADEGTVPTTELVAWAISLAKWAKIADWYEGHDGDNTLDQRAAATCGLCMRHAGCGGCSLVVVSAECYQSPYHNYAQAAYESNVRAAAEAAREEYAYLVKQFTRWLAGEDEPSQDSMEKRVQGVQGHVERHREIQEQVVEAEQVLNEDLRILPEEVLGRVLWLARLVGELASLVHENGRGRSTGWYTAMEDVRKQLKELYAVPTRIPK